MTVSLKNKIMCITLAAGLVAGCQKDNDKFFPDPYAGGKPQLGVKFSEALPSPSSGAAGEKVTYSVRGLLAYKDSIHFFQNGEEAAISSVTDSTLTVVVPAQASTGTGWVTIGAQVFPAPLFRVRGKARLDNTFKSGSGTDGLIYQIIPTSDNRYLLTGSFRLYNSNGQGNWLNGIAKIEKHGQYVTDMSTDSAAGRNGRIHSAAELEDGRFIVAGAFSTYGYKKGLFNFARVNISGKIDTTVQTVIPEEYNYDPDAGLPDMTEALSKDTVSAFNGGSSSAPTKIFARNGRVIAFGSLGLYQQIFYKSSTRNAKVTDRRVVHSVMAMDLDGNLDSTYHYDLANHEGMPGADGYLADAILMDDGKLVMVGKFPRFDGVTAGNIARLDANGRVDNTFKAGSGANGDVFSITFNKTTRKFLITGNFTSYNGQPCHGLMLLNEDGSPVTNFQTDVFLNGYATYAMQLKNGMIVVTGGFEKYGTRIRRGMVILNADGSYAAAYNNTGDLNGAVYGMLETTSAEGETAVLIYGYIPSFDNTNVGNIFRLVLAK